MLVLAGALVYANSFSVPFVFDDKDIILANPAVRDPHAFLSPGQFGTRVVGYLTFAINFRLSGQDVFGYHLFNLAIHLLNGLLVYRLGMTLARLGRQGAWMEGEQSAERIGLIAATVFLLHPLQTQAVTYLSQRFASLATLFYLAAVASYFEWRSAETQGKRVFFYVAAFLATFCAMHTKEIAATIPFAFVLCEAVFPDKGTRRRIVFMLPFLLTLIIIPAHQLRGQFSADAIERGMTAAGSPAIPQSDYLITELRVLVTYLRLILFPVNQSAEYEYPVFTNLLSPEPIFSVMLLCLLFGAGLFLCFRYAGSEESRAQRLLVAFGIFWFFLALSIESSVIPIADVMFEHRMYLPMAGVSLAAASGLEWCAQRIGARAVHRVIIAVLLCFSVLTVMRNHVWGDEMRLWEDNAVRQPRHARVFNNLGVAYMERNMNTEAVKAFSAAVQIRPWFADAHYNLGNSHYAGGAYQSAVMSYEKAVAMKGDEPDYRLGLGNAYYMSGALDPAEVQFRAALLLRPESAVAHNNLGSVLLKKGDAESARREFEIAISLRPDYMDARRNLERFRGQQ